MRPPCWTMMLRQMARPRPVPPLARESEASTWWKRSKMCSSLSAGMPRPWSRTSMRASFSSRLRAVRWISLPGEAVGVVDGNLEHLLGLLGTGGERAAGEEAEGSAERGERGSELVGDGGDELVLHAVEGAALGDVGEGDDYADSPGFAAPGGVGVDLGAGHVVDGEAGSIFAPEDLVGDADGVQVDEALANRRVLGGVVRAVGAGVVDEVVEVAAEHLVLLVAEHLGGC